MPGKVELGKKYLLIYEIIALFIRYSFKIALEAISLLPFLLPPITNAMMKYLISVLFTFLSTGALSQTQYQYWQWAKSFGGSGNDYTVDMKIKNGFLYVTGTFTSHQINWDGTILTNSGGKDIFIAKLDTLGNTVWVQSFGGSGDDDVQQLEINSNGAMALRCKSASSSLNMGSNLLTTPGNFYTTFGIDGNILNSVVLPVGPLYSDIDIDNENAVYISGSYQHPFILMVMRLIQAMGLQAQ